MDIERKPTVEKPPSEFLALSTEVRELIYESIFKGSEMVFMLEPLMQHSPLTFWKNTLPGICFVNRQVHAEALSVWFRCTLFVVSKATSPIGFNLFCKKYDLLKDVRRLEFEESRGRHSWQDPTPFPGTPAAHNLVKECRGLQELSFTLSVDALTELEFIASKPLHSVVDHFRFESPFDLSCLRILQLFIEPYLPGTRYEDEHKRFRSLAWWYSQAFKECGSTTTVRSTWDDRQWHAFLIAEFFGRSRYG